MLNVSDIFYLYGQKFSSICSELITFVFVWLFKKMIWVGTCFGFGCWRDHLSLTYFTYKKFPPHSTQVVTTANTSPITLIKMQLPEQFAHTPYSLASLRYLSYALPLVYLSLNRCTLFTQLLILLLHFLQHHVFILKSILFL